MRGRVGMLKMSFLGSIVLSSSLGATGWFPIMEVVEPVSEAVSSVIWGVLEYVELSSGKTGRFLLLLPLLLLLEVLPPLVLPGSE